MDPKRSRQSASTRVLDRASSIWRGVPWVVIVFVLHALLMSSGSAQTPDVSGPPDAVAPTDAAAPADLVGPTDASAPKPADASGGAEPPPASPPSTAPSAATSDSDKDAAAPDKEPEPPFVRPDVEFRPPRVVVDSLDDVATVEDPVTLESAGRHWLANGNAELARACFVAALERAEINHYADLADSPYGKALVHEHMEEWTESRALWRETFRDDIITAYYYLARFSEDSKRAALLSEAEYYIKYLVQRAKRGEEVHFYTTKKGKSRKLQVISEADAIAAFEAGERLRYAYIEKLDLSNRDWPKRVGCKRCVVGSLDAYGATFAEQLDFHGVVLGSAHLGKRWSGEVNRSKATPAATFNNLFLGNSVFLRGLNLDSVKLDGRVLNLPMAAVMGELDLRNATVNGNLELRYAYVDDRLSMRGAYVENATYLGHADLGSADLSRVDLPAAPLLMNSTIVRGPLTFEDCEMRRGATLEHALLWGPVRIHQCRFYDRINLSRARLAVGIDVTQVEATNVDVFGAEVFGDAQFSDSTYGGNVRFAVDDLTRRLHLDDPAPLHSLYKQYQGDVDAKEDLTTSSQYGVAHVDDLTATFHGNVSFANSIFGKFVSFEGVSFGQTGRQNKTSFYNAQFHGEAHFERSRYYTPADFRTISGDEISFNWAEFHDDWMLDDANVPGRLTMSGADLVGDAKLSFYGARIAAFNVSFRQLIDEDGAHRLFYETCVLDEDGASKYASDPRLADAGWDSDRDAPIRDPDTIAANVRRLCMERNISEFVALKDSFNKRSMNEESDWAYWHLRHYKNARDIELADGIFGKLSGWIQWLLFEKAFGWGVHLSNLLWTALVVILLFMGLQRWLCPDLLVELDNETSALRDLPLHAQFMLSLHCFLGRARDWRAKSSNRTWKVLYITELVLGIILITFFIGAYTRMVLR